MIFIRRFNGSYPIAAMAEDLTLIISMNSLSYFFLVCARAEPAADFEAALVLPSLSTADAAVAALAEVTLGGETCESELPAALLEDLPVDVLERTPDDLLATL